eukprot:symbB.v1.2.032876.t1/scaffold4001.1/size60404/3
MGDPRMAAEILDRAVHHLPGSIELWFRLHEAMEAAGSAVGDLKAVTSRAQRAMKAHPEPSGAQRTHELLLQHADACRRYADGSRGHTAADAEEAWCEMRRTLKEASEADLGTQALLHWMKLEGYGAQNLDQVLLVGRQLMESWGAFYNAWSAFIAAARHASKIGSGTSVVEALYKDAIAQVSDYPEQVRSDYLQFQRESGTLQGWLSAKAAMAVAPPAEAAPPEAAPPEAALVEDSAMAKVPKPKVPKTAPKPKAAKRLSAFRSQAQEKRQKTEGSQAFEGVVEKAEEGTEPQKETKESKEQEPTEPTEATEPTIEAKGGKAEEATGQDTEPETPTKAIEAKDADLKDTAGDAMEDVSEKMLEEKQNEEKPQPHKGSHYHQLRLAEKAAELKPEDEGEHTIYVANLDWSVDEAQLYRIFQDIEGSKGYAYVDFDSPEHVAEAVEKFSGHLVNNRVMKVAKSLPTKQLYEEKVLFVRNIGESAKEESVSSVSFIFQLVEDTRILKNMGPEFPAFE